LTLFHVKSSKFYLKARIRFATQAILQRFMRIRKTVPGFAVVQMPWGAKIGVHPNET